MLICIRTSIELYGVCNRLFTYLLRIHLNVVHCRFVVDSNDLLYWNINKIKLLETLNVSKFMVFSCDAIWLDKFRVNVFGFPCVMCVDFLVMDSVHFIYLLIYLATILSVHILMIEILIVGRMRSASLSRSFGFQAWNLRVMLL